MIELSAAPCGLRVSLELDRTNIILLFSLKTTKTLI